jgi:hypothetical protein
MPKPLTLRDLATAQGALRLQRALGGSDEQTGKSLLVASRFLKDNPELGSLQIGRASSSFFDHNNPRVGLSSSDPSVLAHELGHAADLGLDSSLYKNTITPYSKSLVGIMDRAALPAALAASSLFSNEDSTRYINYATAVAALAATPNLYNEAKATHIAASKSNDYLKTIAKLAPGFVSHSLESLSPVAKLQAIKYIKDMPRQHQAIAMSALTATGA